MKKALKKIATLALTGVMLATTMSISACGIGKVDEGVEIDPNKTQIYIAIGDNGIGTAFLDTLKTKYEALHDDIQVVYQIKDSEISAGEQCVTTLTDDIVLTTFGDYKMYGNYLLDVTDAVTAKAYDNDFNYIGMNAPTATKSLKDRMSDEVYVYFNRNNDGTDKFLAMPWFDYLFGMWYDVDLFNEKSLFFDSENEIGAKLQDVKAGIASKGPDGISGTYDDGLPATWEEFKDLLYNMKYESNVASPFVWSGENSWMYMYWLDQIFCQYEGIENYRLNYNFNGTHSVLGEINNTNGYKLHDVEGYKALLTVCEYITNEGMIEKNSFKSTQTHLAAQQAFLNGAGGEIDRCAFLIDGSWWRYEAKDSFSYMAKKNNKYSYENRKFAYMPFPHFKGTDGLTDSAVDYNVIQGSLSYAVIPLKKTTHPELVKDFMLFMQDNTNLYDFLAIDNMIPAVDIKLSDSQYNSLNYMAQNQVDIMKEKSSGKTREYLRYNNSLSGERESSFYNLNKNYFTGFDFGADLRTLLDSTKYAYVDNPLKVMAANPGKVTAEKYLEGRTAYAEGRFDQTGWNKQNFKLN